MVTIQLFARPPYTIDDNVIHKSIKYLISGKQETKQHPFLLIAELIKWIKSKKLLDNILELLANAGYFQYSEDFESELQSNHFFNSADEEAKTRIRAILYSELLVIEIIKRQFSAIDLSNPPVLNCWITTESVTTNSDEIFEYIREAVNKHTLATIKNLKPSEQELEYTRLINNMASLQFENRSNFFQSEIENMTALKSNLPHIEGHKNSIKQRSIFYPKLGSLFAQGLIFKKRADDGINFKYYYSETSFDTIPELGKHIQKVLDTEKKVLQYLKATLNDYTKKGSKNFYRNNRLIKKTIEYCREQNIEIKEWYLKKLNDNN
tara:strand:+ start:2796 stop:3761 length:966 start_codon:yes stop_codon:yes gene_type:complete